MNRFSLYLVMILFPSFGYSQQAFSPVHNFFNSDGTSVYGEYVLDSIDNLGYQYSEVKLIYNEDCILQSIDYLFQATSEEDCNVTFTYHRCGTLKSRIRTCIAEEGLITYDTTRYTEEGLVLEEHITDSKGDNVFQRRYSYNDAGEFLTIYSLEISEDERFYNYYEWYREYIYVSENIVDVHSNQTRIFRFENNPPDTSISSSKATYISDNGILQELIVEEDGNEIQVIYTYENGKLVSLIRYVNSEIDYKIVYEYLPAIPECDYWTNDIWEVSDLEEVVCTTYFHKRNLELIPVQRSCEAVDTNGNSIYFEVEIYSEAESEWSLQSKRLRHYDVNGGLKYLVHFDPSNALPSYLSVYETDEANNITRVESYYYDVMNMTWSELSQEIVNTYNEDNNITSIRITDSTGVSTYDWRYTDFGALLFTDSGFDESNFYYSIRCRAEPEETSIPDIYPNPVSKMLTVCLDETDTELNLRVFDTSGALVLKQHKSIGMQIDVSTLTPGVYILQGWDTNSRWQQKFVKVN